MVSADFIFATNNMMALPRNPKAVATLKAAPHASIVAVQEANLRPFKNALHKLGPHRRPASGFTGRGQAFSCVVLFDPTVWDEVESHYPLAYHGHHGISYDRHLGVTELRHRAAGFRVGVVSYHAVTAGRDRQRRRMRSTGDGAVRAEIAALRSRGLPVLLGCDQNATGNRLGPADFHSAHRLDHIYGWDGSSVDISKGRRRVIDTRSDHDVLVNRIHAEVR